MTHHSLQDIGAFMPSAHDGRGIRKLQKEESGGVNAVHTNPSTIIALVESYMKYASHFGVYYMRSSCIVFVCYLYKSYIQTEMILLSGSVDGFYKNC